MDLSEYIKQDGIGLAKLIKNKHIKAEEPMQCAIKLIEQVNPQLNAVVAEHFDLALTHLHKADSNAPFYGVPTLIKDLYFTVKGTPLTNGSRYFQHNTSTSNCQFTQALLDSGSLILGKTNTAELGLSYSCESSLLGACHNPWNLSLSSGGSSGGSAAAVAARIVPFAAGNDSGGSLRTPAACCGMFGLKPTHGSTPHNFNEAEQWSGLLSNHVITRSVRDSHQIFTTLKKDKRSTHAPTKQTDTIKIALLSGVFPQVDIHRDCQDAVELAATMSEQFGHRVEPVNLQIDTHRIDEAIFVIIAINILNVLKQQKQRCGRSHNAHNIESITQAFANSARQMRQCDILQAKKAIHDSIKPLQLLFLDYDLVLTPAIAQPPIALGCITPSDDLGQFMQKCTRFSPFTGLFNQSGQPAMTLPILFRDQQPPISVQFAAGLHQEHLLFELAYQFERRNPWAEKIPLITQPFI